jgi:hypothetical protein
MRMMERRESLRLALETLSQVRIGRDVLGKNFDRNRALEPRVGGFVNLSHTAGPDRTGDRVGAEPCAG